ncbi:LysR family transcriptional regulator [Novosphingobium mangrovi (ex Hu et al. 2023)]|uniref:LysR family transcriptional regulator n=1 Tax=Novosphingobium mangrovi (ex Hu et al. 2023) TaxID=2930094 RepID=A0ABT0A7V0_9SPHN|nr:LysR family transcriptional regulator [Novosphingobium mangrovi (ex Hu et al. 2023)]MCJ1959234.1 LysR family transcriptional regulator [Novosphingobium mangrovi (ex Hu et al. 2023)]
MPIPDADWSDFQAFLAIARSGQLARAARRLGVNPTTMGRRLRRLEAALGTTLFEQTRTGQVLTEAGEALLAAVEQMDRAASGITGSGEGEDGLTGTLRIGTPEGFATDFLSPRLAQFQSLHPGLAIDLVSAPGEALSPGRREADVAIVLARPRKGPLVAHKLADYALGLYASADYLAAHGVPRAPADLLEGHRLVGYIPDRLHAPELRYLDEIHPALKASLRAPSITAQHSLIANGAGVGVLPAFMAHADPRLVPVLSDVRLERAFWFVTHEDIRRLPRIRAFRQWLDETVRAGEEVLMPRGARAAPENARKKELPS